MLEPVTTSAAAPLVVQTIGVVVLALSLVTVFALPLMRAPLLLWAGIRWLMRTLPELLHPRSLGLDQARPLNLAGLTPSLTRLTRQTRTLALELRRCSGEAAQWVSDDDPNAPPRSGWRESVFGDVGGRMSLTELRGEVFEWLRLAETLDGADRDALTDLGVDVDAVRAALTADKRSALEIVRSLAGLLWTIDDRLASACTAGYRSTCAENTSVVSIHPLLTDDDDARARRRRWAGTLAENGRGISRLAASYTRNPAEREDLEQDIALALWRALPGFRGESSLKTFAYRIARYCCFRHVRRRSDVDTLANPQTIADPSASIESTLLQADQRARIEQALGDLPGTLESVLTMHLTGHSYAQIAESLGISERNVGVRLSRARARLRRQLVAA